jgi:hypothetical protein
LTTSTDSPILTLREGNEQRLAHPRRFDHMAKLAANGTEIARFEVTTENGAFRASLRSTGAVLRQHRICGRWEGWKQWLKTNGNVTASELQVFLSKKGDAKRID